MERLFSIRGKITLLVFGVVLVLTIVNAWVAPSTAARNEHSALAERAQAEAELLADSVSAAMEFEQLDAARQGLNVALADPLVAWAAIYSPRGERVVTVGRHRSLDRIPMDSDQIEAPSWVRVQAAKIVSQDIALGAVAVALRTSAADDRIEKMRTDALQSAGFVALFGLLVAWYLAGRITGPLQHISLAAGRIAEGDVSGDVVVPATKDEVAKLGVSFRTMTQRLRQLTARIGKNSDELASAAAGMFSEVREQEALATQQTASLEEIRRTLETLSSSAEHVAVDAETVRQMALRNLDSSQTIAERTKLVSEHSDRIGEILSLIQDIADKSDLLALNAALEGTKAGEVGRGFSLVAAEMRRLSEHVVDSVRDIRKLIADTREASHASVLATEEGIKLSQQTATAAAKISDAVAKQREGTTQVKSSADEIVRVVNESLTGRAETTRSAEGLLQLSQDLKDAMSAFRSSSHPAGTSTDERIPR